MGIVQPAEYMPMDDNPKSLFHHWYKRRKLSSIQENVNNQRYQNGNSTQSGWFRGFDEKFFYQRGTTNRYMLGLPVSLVYAVYYTIVKYPEYRGETSAKDALWYTLKGIFANDIAKQRRKRP